MSESSRVLCRACGDSMALVETVQQPKGPTLELYRCPRHGCELQAALMFEIQGGLTDDQRSWVEREVARRGSFFPNDYMGDGGAGRRDW